MAEEEVVIILEVAAVAGAEVAEVGGNNKVEGEDVAPKLGSTVQMIGQISP